MSIENKVSRAELSFGKNKLHVETGRIAKQAAGSVLVRVGDTVVLVSAAISQDIKEGQDFFPLTVDYRERTYAAGRIPGGFFKRETRPREKETLTSRLIDRAVRPLFPEGFRNAVQITAIVMSTDLVNDTDIPSIIGASLALSLSEAPFKGPIAALRVGLVNGQFIINPNYEEQKMSELDLVVAGNKNGVMMVEAGANEISEEKMQEAFKIAEKEINRSCDEQIAFYTSIAKKKMVFEAPVIDAELSKAVDAIARPKIREVVRTPEKTSREDAFSTIKKGIVTSFLEKYPEQKAEIGQVIEGILYEEARALILKDKVRTDGRKWDQIRPITCEVDILPRTHGSALFTRGQTQALATVTLGTPADKQVMDDLEGEYKERFMMHYNFPGFATGEAKPDRSPGRREIGHGALARRALLPLLPPEDDFPYTVRVVSDIMESNGSSSMASVCGGSLALFDAGVKLRSACAGIAMGLIIEGNDQAVLSDIMGLEDHLGDMDFKVAGTRKGITALQMDIKIEGISMAIVEKAIAQAKAGRMHILDLMEKALPQAKPDFSPHAPRMVMVQIPVEKIGALIGPGGKNIRKIIEDTGAQVDVDDDGKVYISGTDSAAVERATLSVQGSASEIEVGKTYTGKVTRIMEFGAFVEVLPGKEGLVHISQLAAERVAHVEDVVKEGETITVKCVEKDTQGRYNFSRKVLLVGDDAYTPGGRPPRPVGAGREGRKFRE